MTSGLDIYFCITCKGRLHHLKKTLPENLAKAATYPNAKFVVLDYDSQDGLEDWIRANFMQEIKSGRLIYAKHEPAQYFKMAHAKNMAHRVPALVTDNKDYILCNLDADNSILPEYISWLNQQFSADKNIYTRTAHIDLRMYHTRFDWAARLGFHTFDNCSRNTIGILGRIAISRESFYLLRGYDETFSFWGGDDDNFIMRAENLGLSLKSVPMEMFGIVLQHNNDLRIAELSEQDQVQTKALFRTKKNRWSRFGNKFTELISPEPPALSNSSGNCGCGEVTVNFSEKLSIEPLLRVKSTPRLSATFELR